MFKKLTALFLILGLMVPLAAMAYTPEMYSREKGYQYVAFGRYPQAADGAEAPIVWRVLEAKEGVLYLLAERLLFAAMVHPDNQKYPGWEKSELNATLNGAFLDKAFSAEEKTALVDKGFGMVSLPSSQDIKNKEFGFFKDKDRKINGTDYAKANGLYRYTHEDYSPFWTRTESSKTFAQVKTKQHGEVGYIAVTAADVGVRPVIWLDLTKLASASGTGSLEDPILLTVGTGNVPQVSPASTAEPETEAPDTGTEAAAPEQADSQSVEEVTSKAAEETTVAEQAGRDDEFDLGLKPRQAFSGKSKVEGFPDLTDEGFLPEGQEPFVQQDEEAGVWRYASQDLRVEIHRRHDDKAKLTWFETEVFARDKQAFRMVPSDVKNRERNYDMVKIATDNNLVLAVNGDYYIYRVRRKRSESGIVIGKIARQGEVLFDPEVNPDRTVYPNLDVLALFNDGNMMVAGNNDYTAEALVKAGARDVLAFGPVLIKNGQLNEAAKDFGTTAQPRAAIGMVENGHYWHLVMEGRIQRSKGTSSYWLGEKLHELGCKEAINLDGGQTAVVIFMGQLLNKISPYDNNNRNPRHQTEVIGIGGTITAPVTSAEPAEKSAPRVPER